MPTLRIPWRCFWCRAQGPDVDVLFDVSHVVPECVGNEQQMLPRGVVCKKCNQCFGSKVEPALLEDPLFHMIGVSLRLKDSDDKHVFRDRFFEDTHPSDPEPPWRRTIHMKADVEGQAISVNITYTETGLTTRKYGRKDLQQLSRAVHEIAFEALAWQLFVEDEELEHADLFSCTFDPVRLWAREGSPRILCSRRAPATVKRRTPTVVDRDMEVW